MALKWLLWLGLLGLLGCTPSAPAAPSAVDTKPVETAAKPSAGAASASPGQSSGPAAQHVVVAVVGQLSFKHENWSQFAPATFGTVVQLGDFLKLESPSQAKVVCADLTLAVVPSGTAGVPCQVARPRINTPTGAIRATRGDSASDLPQVILPRKTRVLAERPLIRWLASSGATTYKVTVRGPNVNWSSDVSGKTELQYPVTAPTLAPGEAYKVTVVATTPRGNRSSDDEGAPDLGFTMATMEERTGVMAARDKVNALPLDDPQKRFLLAKLYGAQDNALYGEGIDQLEALVGTLPSEPSIPRVLGDYYRQISLNRLAEERYVQALGLSQKINDLVGQALVNESLVQLYNALGNPTEASKRAQQAVELYQQLGDAAKVKELQDRQAGAPK